MKHITMLAFEQSLGSSIIMPMELFSVANIVCSKGRNQKEKKEICFDVVTQDGNDVAGFGTPVISATASIEDVKQTDYIIISSVWKEVTAMLENNRRVIPWLAQQYRNGAGIAATSTGTFLLAETGLLDRKEATTYWSYVDLFRKRYPKVNLKPEKTITAVDNLICYSGVNSGLDLATYMIEKIYGTETAQRVEKYYFVDSNRVYKSSNISFMGQKYHNDKKIIHVQEWIENNYARSFLLEEIAIKFGMSLRNLTRRFKLATGESLLAYLHRYRIEVAKELLRTGVFTIQEIAFQVGFGDTSYFYHLFKKHTLITPKSFHQNLQRNK